MFIISHSLSSSTGSVYPTGSARNSRAGGARQEGNTSDGDDGEEEYDDHGCLEGQGQKREREKRREYFLSMIADSFRTIGSCYAQANRTIRDIENNQASASVERTASRLGKILLLVRAGALLMMSLLVGGRKSIYLD